MAGPGSRRPQPRPGRSADSGLAVPASPGPPTPQPLPSGRGSPPCRRLGSRRSARSPWRRAIRTARPAQRCSASRTARSATPRSTWDVALAAARAGPHSPPGDRLRAATAAATPQTAPPSGSRRELEPAGSRGEEPGRARKTAEIRLRARRLAMGPRSGQDSSRAILRSRKKSCLVAAPPGGQRQKKGGSKCQARWTLGLFLGVV